MHSSANSNRNLHIHNLFTIGPQPTLPCLEAGCRQFFKNRSGCKSQVLAAHPHLNESSNHLHPPIGSGLGKPLQDPVFTYPSMSEVLSSSPGYSSDSSDSSEGLPSSPSVVGSDLDVEMVDVYAPQLPYIKMDVEPLEPPSPSIPDLSLLRSPPPPFIDCFPPPSVPSTMASDDQALSSTDDEHITHNPRNLANGTGDSGLGACGPAPPCITHTYHRQMNGR